MEFHKKEMFDFYQINFKSMFADSRDITELANKAFQNKAHQESHFQNRIEACVAQVVSGNENIQSYLSGWDTDYTNQIIDIHGGLLYGLFHFGHHRHFLLDSVANELSIVAPIAGKAYSELQHLASLKSEHIANRIKLLEVEEEKVSRDLIRELKQRKVGGIYVDGNMGPSSTSSKEGCITVEFFDHRISVKAGIARLSQLMKLPILPVFCIGSLAPRVEFGQLILPPFNNEDKQQHSINVMQYLYKGLQLQVEKSPADWEYALCLHRWLNDKQDRINSVKGWSNATSIKLNMDRVTPLEKGQELYLVNSKSYKGFKVPYKLKSLIWELINSPVIPLEQFVIGIKKYNVDPEVLINEMHNSDLVTLN